MNEELSPLGEHLEQFRLLLHQLRDQAEAKIPEINEQIDRLFASNFIGEGVFLGDVILERLYPPGGPIDRGEVVVAVLRVPGGIGALNTDSESYWVANRTQCGVEEMAMTSMTAFDRCEPIIKARLLDQVKPLVQQFLKAMDIVDPQ